MSRRGQLPLGRREFLASAAGASALVALGASAAEAAPPAPLRQVFDLGWRFHRGAGVGFEASGLDDSAWRVVDVPHDWSVEDLPIDQANEAKSVVGPFSEAASGGGLTGFTTGGEGWYRKTFRLDKPAQGHVEVLFEGVYMDSDVWINGQHLGTHVYGYTSFAYDLTPHLSATGTNVIAVRVRNLGSNSRWYAGSGIYRHVWLDVWPEQTRIERWGVGMVTRQIADGAADIEITTRLVDAGPGLTLVSVLKDAAGRVVGKASAVAQAQVTQALHVQAPRLWSPQAPQLYKLETQLRRGTVVLDTASHNVGIRIVEFDATRGMTINGKSTKLRGGCIHHDNGLLGAMAFDAAEERKVLLLKARGFNAVRPSHNPFSTAFLTACDRHGLLVVGETFDTWHDGKLPQDYGMHFEANWRKDLAASVLGARNHPSIVMWSIGNEVPGRNSAKGLRTQWDLVNEVHRLDPTRAVTAAVHGFPGRPVTPAAGTARAGHEGVTEQMSTVFLDVVGYNYKLDDYQADHARYPQRVFFGAESYPKDAAAIWALTEQSSWLIGDFVWTAMDYLGEAGIGGNVTTTEVQAKDPAVMAPAWPWVNAFCGDVDLIGQQKPQSLARDVLWGVSPLELAVRRPVEDGTINVPRQWGWADEHASWTWPGAEGRTLAVRAYTSGDRVDLFLNGHKVGSRAVGAGDMQRVDFAVPYEPGTLEAVSYRDGKSSRKKLVTTGTPVALRLTPERAWHGIGRGDVSFVGVEVLDAAGRPVPEAAYEVELRLSGPARLAAFGSANPLAVGSFQSRITKTWKGRALAVLRGTGKSGQVTVEVRAAGLSAARTTLRFEPRVETA